MRLEKNKGGYGKQTSPQGDKEEAELPPFFVQQNRDDNEGHANNHGGYK